MKKYFITIVNCENLTQHHLERDETTIDNTIQKELGGWGNLSGSGASGSRNIPGDFMKTGTTRDGKKAFSVICLVVE